MKLYCPRCHAENTDENAQAGAVRCVSCEKWFSLKGSSPWGKAPALADSSKPVNVAQFIWPAVLLVVLLLGIFGPVPLLWTLIFALFAILGSILSALNKK
jgi:hypothetical protein